MGKPLNLNQNQTAIDAILAAGWIRDVQWFSEIDSTNSAARRVTGNHEGNSALLPTLFVADRQTTGRGRSQRVWWSPEGCLMLTLALSGQTLPSRPEEWSQLALLSGMAVANTVAQFVEPNSVQLKWPNDVYVLEKKIAGVLIESDTKVWLVGIGLNVNMNWSAAPKEIARQATCMRSASGCGVEVPVVLVELMEELHRTLEGWRRGEFAWQAEWQQRCLLTGRVVHIRISDNREIIGRCEGIDACGRLIVRDEHGVHQLTAGEVLAWH